MPVNSRKLLVAAIGVAAVSYVGCTSALQENPTSGNLMSYPADSGPETGSFPTSGNLMAPDATVVDSGDGGAGDAGDDAGDAGDAADAAND